MVEHDGWYGDDKWCLAMQFSAHGHHLRSLPYPQQEGLIIFAYFMDTGGGDYGGTYKNSGYWHRTGFAGRCDPYIQQAYDFDHVNNAA